MAAAMILKANPGPQELFLSSPADVVLYGGGAGGGKTYGMLMDALRYVGVPGYRAVFFRRTTPQLFKAGGLFDEASGLYTLPGLGATPVRGQGHAEFRFPSGAVVSMSHLQHEKNRFDWQGAQLAGQYWDELTHHSWGVFSYLLTRMRSKSGVRPYVRATCNPDPDHWLRSFIDWYIGDDGFPVPARSGVVRWFSVLSNEVVWGRDRHEILKRAPEARPLSFTFVPATLDDNPELDGDYEAFLLSQPEHVKQQMRYGNWDARVEAGNYFRRTWFEFLQQWPEGSDWQFCRYWDRAATEPGPGNPDPDYTVGGLLGRNKADGRVVVCDVERFRATPGRVRDRILRRASADGKNVVVGLEREPGASGKSEAQNMAGQLGGYDVRIRPATTSKEVSWLPLSRQAEARNVAILNRAWTEDLLKELERVPEAAHDDQADSLAGAYNVLTAGMEGPMLGRA